jgi:hypothetical protein
MSFRIGRFALVLEWRPANPWTARWAWGLHKWSWQGQSSWRHGAAYLGKLKIVW